MVITDKLLARIAIQGKENRVVAIDPQAVVTRLLLFQTYILHSIQLDDLPFLAKLFGEEGLIGLFDAGALKVLFETYAIGQTGQVRAQLRLTGNNKRLPLGSYSFSTLRLQDQEKVAQQKLDSMSKPLASAVRANLIAMPGDFSAKVFDGFYSDLRQNLPVVENSIRYRLQRSGIKPKKLKVQVVEIEPEDFRVDTNLGSDYSLPEEIAHSIVERALLEISGLNQRLAEMSTYGALTGIREDDKPLLEGKLETVANLVDSADHQGRFKRVTEIAGLHTLAAGNVEVDAKKLIRTRDSDECRVFRDWLRGTDTYSDTELSKLLIGLNSRIREAINSQPGKTVRFLISGGLSAVAGPLAGLTIGAIDSFVLDQLAPKNAIVSFLSDSYPSLFHRPKKD